MTIELKDKEDRIVCMRNEHAKEIERLIRALQGQDALREKELKEAAASGHPVSLSGAYEFVGRLHGHEGAIHTLDFSSEGTYLASGGESPSNKLSNFIE
jgi:hypothetical protein